MTPKTLEAVKRGILTDQELDEALTFFERLQNDLSLLGPVFELPRKDVDSTLQSLRSMFKARASRG